MRASAPWKEWTGRVLQLGLSRLALGLAVLFVLLALATPLWSLTSTEGVRREVNEYGWTTVTITQFRSGQWDGTEILPFSSSNLDPAQPNVAAVMGGGYLSMVVYLIVLIVTIVIFSMAWSKTMSPLVLLILSLFVTIVALWTLFGPILGIQNAAPTDLASLGVSGFWGTRSAGTTTVTWGGGLGWWFILVATILGIVGVALPYMKSVRAMGAARPRSWAPRP